MSNIEQADGNNVNIGTHDRAQQFTTGPNETGYILSFVEGQLILGADTASVTMDVWLTTNRTNPTRLVTLENPSDLTGGLKRFSAPAGTVLAPNTSYWVVFEAASTGTKPRLRATPSDIEVGLPGWSIDDDHRSRPATETGNFGASNTSSLEIRIGGVPAPFEPAVRGVEIISNPGPDSTYGEDAKIRVQMAFSTPVLVDTTGGTPQVGLVFHHEGNPTSRTASYVSGSGTKNLVFEYTVVAADGGDEGVAVTENSLALNSGTIRSVGNLLDATLAHAGLAKDTDHLVDGSVEESVVLVSNIGQTAHATLGCDLMAGGSLGCGQAFTTGAHASGYLLSNVEMKFVTAPTNVSVQLRTELPSDGGALVATLTNPGTLAAGDLTFTAPEGTLLEASTRYWLIITGDSGKMSETSSNGEDTGGLDNWSVSDFSFWHSSNLGWTISSDALMIRLRGLANTGTVPSKPATPTSSAQSSYTLTVGWTAPSDPGSASSIGDYQLRYFEGAADPDDAVDWVIEGEAGGPPDPGANTTATIKGLEAATAYRVQVRALGDAWSPWSDSLAVTTKATFDTDHDTLIEISSPAQLNAIRWDHDADGVADTHIPRPTKTPTTRRSRTRAPTSATTRPPTPASRRVPATSWWPTSTSTCRPTTPARAGTRSAGMKGSSTARTTRSRTCSSTGAIRPTWGCLPSGFLEAPYAILRWWTWTSPAKAPWAQFSAVWTSTWSTCSPAAPSPAPRPTLKVSVAWLVLSRLMVRSAARCPRWMWSGKAPRASAFWAAWRATSWATYRTPMRWARWRSWAPARSGSAASRAMSVCRCQRHEQLFAGPGERPLGRDAGGRPDR